MRLKKVLAVGIASALALGTFTGCGSTASTGNSGGSSQSAEADSGEIVNLKWITIGNGMPVNYDTWVAKVNEYAGEKIGVNI